MADFFSEKTNEYLIGIRYNNNKQWFQEHKDMYREYVHGPMLHLSEELFKKFHEYDRSFNEKPKISRANRDIRFSNNKNPYKECKWFFLRADGSPHITYPNPTFFFEISPDWWRYGFFFYADPKGMAEFRKKIDANVSACRRVIKKYNAQDVFVLSGEKYKRIYNKDLPEDIMDWAQRKYLDFIRYEDYGNMEFYSEDLADIVFERLKLIYPVYKFFLR